MNNTTSLCNKKSFKITFESLQINHSQTWIKKILLQFLTCCLNKLPLQKTLPIIIIDIIKTLSSKVIIWADFCISFVLQVIVNLILSMLNLYFLGEHSWYKSHLNLYFWIICSLFLFAVLCLQYITILIKQLLKNHLNQKACYGLDEFVEEWITKLNYHNYQDVNMLPVGKLKLYRY